MKARKEEKSSLCGVLMVLVAIAVGVAGIVYALSTPPPCQSGKVERLRRVRLSVRKTLAAFQA